MKRTLNPSIIASRISTLLRTWCFLTGLILLAESANGTTIAYDRSGRIEKATSIDGTAITCDYDASGNIKKMISGAGEGLPVLVSTPTAYGQVGKLFASLLRSSHSATNFSASGLPSGLSIEPSTGQISGSPTIAGVFPLSVTLTSSGGSSSCTVVIHIRPAESAPVVASQPQNQVVKPGGSATLRVEIQGTPPLAFQWQRNGESIEGATRDRLYLPYVTPTEEGSYTLVVTNAHGMTTTSSVTVLLDNNGNDLPDSWESGIFGSTEQSGSGDFDNDKVSNLDEYIEGTSPIDSGDFNPRLTVVGQNGTVSLSPSKSFYAKGQVVSLSATPNAGHYFFGWAGDAWGTESTTAVSMNVHRTVYADFSTSNVRVWGMDSQLQAGIPQGRSTVAVAAGTSHAIALSATGTVVCWGGNDKGQCEVPLELSNITAISVGSEHSLALRGDGTLVAWGDNSFGQIDVPTGLEDVAAVAAGGRFNLALRANGTAVKWGQMAGDNFSELDNIVAIAAGYSHCIALRSDGIVFEWNSPLNTWIAREGLNEVVAIAAGNDHNLALRRDGTVTAWGSDIQGSTVVPATLREAVAIDAGNYSSLALKADGRIVAWGSPIPDDHAIFKTLPKAAGMAGGSWFGLALLEGLPSDSHPTVTSPTKLLGTAGAAFFHQLRTLNGAASFSAVGLPPGLAIHAETGAITGTPTEVGMFDVVITVANGAGEQILTTRIYINSMAPEIRSDSSFIALAGNPVSFQVVATHSPTSFSATGLPDGVTINSLTGKISGTPMTPGKFSITASATNEYGTTSSLVICEVQSVAGWGLDSEGQINTPDDLGPVKAMAAGESHTIALKTDGTVVAWGSNSDGQTGVPVGLTRVMAIAAGARHSLALKEDGSVIAWGYNSDGQATVPANLNRVIAISAGMYHSVALRSNGTVEAWGTDGDDIAVVPDGLDNVVAISAGHFHTLALKADGTVVAWGYNGDLQTLVPSDLHDVVAIAAGSYHSLALKSDGSVQGWGLDSDGQTGGGYFLSDVVAIAAGSYHSLALKADGTIEGWGYNGDWQIPNHQIPNNQIPDRSDIRRVVSIAAGGRHTVALLAAPPAIQGTLKVANFPGTLFDYKISAVNLPQTYAASGLPEGFTLNPLTGRITGVLPETPMRSNFTISASNAYGTGQAILELIVVSNSLGEGVEASTLAWRTGGAASWFNQVESASDGEDAIQSGSITDDNASWVEASVTGPGTLRFKWRVSSEEDYDFLKFSIDGTEMAEISGNSEYWGSRTFSIPAGEHLLRWTYSKDESFSDGADAGWIDQVIYYQKGSYSAWKMTYWGNTPHDPAADELADPDHDGVKNLTEMAFGMNPSTGASYTLNPINGASGLPYIENVGTSTAPLLKITFVRRRSSLLSYYPEFSSDLKNWEPSTFDNEVIEGIDSEWERVLVTDPTPVGPHRFGRVRVISP